MSSYRFLAGFLCSIHLIGLAVTGEHVVSSPKTLPNDLSIAVSTASHTYSLTVLPTSAPQTPHAKNKGTFHPTLSMISESSSKLRRAQTECDLQSHEKTQEYQDMASFIKQMLYLKILEKKVKYAEELQEQRRAEAERLEQQKKHLEWLANVKASNNSGYFPGYTGSDALFCNSYATTADATNYFSDQEKYAFQGSHMNF